MWYQSPPPLTNVWVLHVAATTGQVEQVLSDLCIDQRPCFNGDEAFPVYLRGPAGPYGPTAMDGPGLRRTQPPRPRHPLVYRTVPASSVATATRSRGRRGRRPR